MAFPPNWGTLVFTVVYKMPESGNQEEKDFLSRQAAEDYATTVKLLGGIAIVVPQPKDHL